MDAAAPWTCRQNAVTRVESALSVVLGREMTEMLANANDEDIPKEEIRQKWHQYMDGKTRRAERTYFPTEILTRSSYGYLLDHWFRYFPKRNFLLIDADDIKREFVLLKT